jgi:hypothetical protein
MIAPWADVSGDMRKLANKACPRRPFIYVPARLDKLRHVLVPGVALELKATPTTLPGKDSRAQLIVYPPRNSAFPPEKHSDWKYRALRRDFGRAFFNGVAGGAARANPARRR